jgi:hypothetical protein
MERIVRIVTKNLVSRLPSEQKFYRPDQLLAFELPDFIVDRVTVEIDRNLIDSISLPYTEWADLKNRHVQDAWKEFVESIRSEARLPNAYAANVIECAISDCLDMLLQPRKNIPSMIFGSENALDRETLEERSETVVVYKHLAMAPVKYVYRKNLEAISLDQYKRIIATVDERIVSRYTALNWTQLLEPLFVLLGDSIDTNLLRIFFQDKQRPRIARLFDEMSSSIDRAGLIEALSSPKLLGSAGEPDPKDLAYQDDITEDKKGKPIDGKAESDEQSSGELNTSDIRKAEDIRDEEIPLHTCFMFDETATDISSDESDESALSFNELFINDNETEDLDDKTGDDIIANTFMNTDRTESPIRVPGDDESEISSKMTDEEEESTELQYEVSPEEELDESDITADIPFEVDEDLVKKFEKLSRSNSEGEQESEKSDSSKPIESESDPVDIDQREDDVEKKETYIWKHFLSDDNEEETDDASEASDEGISSLYEYMNEGEDAENISGSSEPDYFSLKEWMQDEANRFTNEIFHGSDEAFEEALEQLSGIDEWKQATRFIEKEVFSRNKIDLYDEIAVDFTDKLHSYFMELNKKKAES